MSYKVSHIFFRDNSYDDVFNNISFLNKLDLLLFDI